MTSRFQGHKQVALRDEIVADVAVVAGFGDGSQDRGIIQFLGVVEVITSWVARRVVMEEVGVMLPDRADHIALLRLSPLASTVLHALAHPGHLHVS